MNLFRAKRTDLLGGITSVLTDRKLSRVEISSSVNTGVTEYDRRDGSIRRIVMPSEKSMPEGMTEQAVEGLMDHERGHVNHTTMGSWYPNGGLGANLLNLIEDPRIERLEGLRYPGAAENIEELNRVGVGLLTQSLEGQTPLGLVLVGLSMEHTCKVDPKPYLAGVSGSEVILDLLDKARPHAQAGVLASSTVECWRHVQELLALLKEVTPPKPKSKPGSERTEQEGSDDETMAPAPSGGNGESGEKQHPSEEGSGSPEDAEDQPESGSTTHGTPKPAGKGESGSEVEGEAEDSSAAEAQAVEDAAAAIRQAAHENNAPRNPVSSAEAVFEMVKEAIEEEITRREEAARAIEAKAQSTGLFSPIYLLNTGQEFEDEVVDLTKSHQAKAAQAYSAILEEVRPVIAGIRSEIRNVLVSEGSTRVRRDCEDGILDPSALYQVIQGTSTRIFQSVVKGVSRKVAVTLLVDLSGSMSGAKVEQATHASIALAEALFGLPGIQTEVLGFTTGRVTSTGEPLRHFIAKPFNIRVSKASALFPEQDLMNNVDGESLRWAARRLLRAKADRRILIVLSDGDPSAYRGGRSLDDDLLSAVKAVENSRIEVIGIGIMSKAVQSFYKKNVVISSAADLTGEVLRQLVRLFVPGSVHKRRAS